jgi:hypothetical protein
MLAGGPRPFRRQRGFQRGRLHALGNRRHNHPGGRRPLGRPAGLSAPPSGPLAPPPRSGPRRPRAWRPGPARRLRPPLPGADDPGLLAGGGRGPCRLPGRQGLDRLAGRAATSSPRPDITERLERLSGSGLSKIARRQASGGAKRGEPRDRRLTLLQRRRQFARPSKIQGRYPDWYEARLGGADSHEDEARPWPSLKPAARANDPFRRRAKDPQAAQPRNHVSRGSSAFKTTLHGLSRPRPMSHPASSPLAVRGGGLKGCRHGSPEDVAFFRRLPYHGPGSVDMRDFLLEALVSVKRLAPPLSREPRLVVRRRSAYPMAVHV